MKNNKIYIIVATALSIILTSLIVFFVSKNISNKKELENKFKDLANDYYEIFSKKNVFGVSEGDNITYTLQDLKELSYNTSEFEDNNCNLKESKATITIKKNGYSIKIKLKCK